MIAIALNLLLPACSSTRTAPKSPPSGNQNSQAAGFRPTEFDPPLPAADFTLTDAKGKRFRLSDLRGKFVLLFFGYTVCPDVCPTTLTNLRRALESLGGDADRVRVVFVTVDPERDTPEKIAMYIESKGDERFIGLTGSRRDLERVWKDYGMFVERQEVPDSAVGYLVTHGASTYLIDPKGRLAASYGFGTQAKDIAADLRRRF